MAGDGDDSFLLRLKEFKEAVASISSEDNLNDCAKKISQVLPWEQPVGLPEIETEEDEDDDPSSQIDDDITEFYNKHVHVAETEFQVAVLHVNFILEYLQTVLEGHELPSVKFDKFVSCGAAKEGMSSRLVPHFDVILPFEILSGGADCLEVITPGVDSQIPTGFVKLHVSAEVSISSQSAKSSRKDLIVIDKDQSGKFLSPTGFREFIVSPLIEEAIAKFSHSSAAAASSFRVFTQKTKKSLSIVIEPNKSWLSVPLKQPSFTISVIPSVAISKGAFPIYGGAKPRYWKNINATDPYNPLWQLAMPNHECHLLRILVPKHSHLKQVLRIFKTLVMLRLKRNSETTLTYLDAYHYKMALLSHLTEDSFKSDPQRSLEDCLAEFVAMMLSKIKDCNITSVFYGNNEFLRRFGKTDSPLKDTLPVNVADTLTTGMVADIRKELKTMLRTYDWGTDVWTLAVEKETEKKHMIEMKKKEAMESKMAEAKKENMVDGDLQKNLADDSIFIRIIGMSVVIALLAVVVYSIFGEFEFGSSEPKADSGVQEL